MVARYGRHVLVCVCGLFLVSAIAGCGSKTPTGKVSGKILFEGEPMKGGGQVVFVPLGTDEGRGAIGAINPEDGTFQLSTFAPGDGAVLGEHRVQIAQDVVIKHAVYEYERGPEGESQKLVSPEERIAKDQEIPRVYGTAKSPLRATVEKGGNTVELELKRKP